ncbi:MAG TPA: hypothetical protein VK750_03220 [Cytophagaceae bacterium]|jgi:hypothetical protein|nr:hypothetical protein [Cytophagaceae bacterium]
MILVQILLPQILTPFIIGWLLRSVKIKKYWSYITTLLLCMSYPFILLNVVHLDTHCGAAHGGLICIPILMIPLTLFCQYLANVAFKTDKSEQ